MDAFNEFCDIAKVSEQKSKFDIVLRFMWFHFYKTNQHEVTISEINQYFDDAHLPKYNPTYLKNDLNKSPKAIKGKKGYKLSRKSLDGFSAEFLPLLNKDISVIEKANINITPFLQTTDIEGARKMAELYVILHCFENSVRNFIEKVLTDKHGADWWDKAKNSDLEKKYKERREKETKQKWLSPRGASPLFYLDWGDLVKIIRKFEADFNPFINNMKFVELRLDELENLRNVIAHNGIITASDDFDRVILHFKDWCKQITSTV